jgi:hypothetical protein
MADKKISQLTALSAANLAPSTDVLAIVDTSATETKKIVAQDLVNGVLNVASAVGIGTSSPSTYTLAPNLVVASSGSGGMTIRSGSSNYGGVFFADGTTGDEQYRGYIQYNHTYAGVSDYMFFGTAGATKMTLDNSGNLGLGVTPSATNGTYFRAYEVGKAGCTLTGATVSLTGNSRLYLSNNAYGTYSGSVAWVYGNTDSAAQYAMESGTHKWFNAPSGTAGNTISFTQAMTLDASGNLGLGITSPSTKLDLKQSTDNAFSGVRIERSATATQYSVLSSAQGTTYLVGVDTANAGNNVLSFGNSVNGSTYNERARITAGGYSKFSNAGTYLDAAGDYHEMRQSANLICTDFSNTNGSFTERIISLRATKAAASDFKFISATANAVEQFYLRGDGVLYAQNTTIQSLSDGRLKENVRNATDGLNVVNALRPVRYDWKEGFGNNRKDQLGFIAQEVEAVFPDAVSEWQKAEGDEEAYKTVGPGALIPVLVKAIQELTARVAALEAK